MIYRILLPEIKTFSSQRAKLVISIEGHQRQINFVIDATDVTALRSTINSILQLIILIEGVHKITQL
jgi:tRNA threonylcarbamoyladenosine modification (KEOPS) complex  Pcc1 subunit